MKKCKLLSLLSAAVLLLTVVLGAIGRSVLAVDLPGGATIAEDDPKLVLARVIFFLPFIIASGMVIAIIKRIYNLNNSFELAASSTLARIY